MSEEHPPDSSVDGKIDEPNVPYLPNVSLEPENAVDVSAPVQDDGAANLLVESDNLKVSSPVPSSTVSTPSLVKSTISDPGFVHPFMAAIQQRQQSQQNPLSKAEASDPEDDDVDKEAKWEGKGAMERGAGEETGSEAQANAATTIQPLSPLPLPSSRSTTFGSLPPTSGTSLLPRLGTTLTSTPSLVPSTSGSPATIVPLPPPKVKPPPQISTSLDYSNSLSSSSPSVRLVPTPSSTNTLLPSTPLSPTSQTSRSIGGVSVASQSNLSPMSTYVGPKILNGPLPYVLGPPHTSYFFKGSYKSQASSSLELESKPIESWYDISAKFGMSPDTVGPGADSSLSAVGEIPLSLLLAPAAPLVALCGCPDIHQVIARTLSVVAGVPTLEGAMTPYAGLSSDPVVFSRSDKDMNFISELPESKHTDKDFEPGFGNPLDIDSSLTSGGEGGGSAFFGVPSNDTTVPCRFISIEPTHMFPAPKQAQNNHEMYNPSGILKVHWLAKHMLHIPAAAVLFFEYKDSVPYDSQEFQILQSIVQFRSLNSARDLEHIVVLVRNSKPNKAGSTAQPPGVLGSPSYDTVSLLLQSRIPGLAKRVHLDPSQIVVLNSADMRNSLPKLDTALSSLLISVMKSKVKNCKGVLSKLQKNTQQNLIARYNFKAAVFSESIRDHANSQMYYRAALQALSSCLSQSQKKGSSSGSHASNLTTGGSLAHPGSAAAAVAMHAAFPNVPSAVAQSAFAVEVRSVHSVFSLRLARVKMQAGLVPEAVDTFQEHVAFAIKCTPGPPKLRTLLLSHLAKQHFAFGELLSQLAPTIQDVTMSSRQVLAPSFYISAAKYESAREALAESILSKLMQNGFEFDEVGLVPQFVTSSTSSLPITALLYQSSSDSKEKACELAGPMRPALYVGQPFPAEPADVSLYHSPTQRIPVSALTSIAMTDSLSASLFRLVGVSSWAVQSNEQDEESQEGTKGITESKDDADFQRATASDSDSSLEPLTDSEADNGEEVQSKDMANSSSLASDNYQVRQEVEKQLISPASEPSSKPSVDTEGLSMENSPSSPTSMVRSDPPPTPKSPSKSGYVSPLMYLDHRLSRATFAFDRWQRGPQTSLFYLSKADDRLRSIQPVRAAIVAGDHMRRGGSIDASRPPHSLLKNIRSRNTMFGMSESEERHTKVSSIEHIVDSEVSPVEVGSLVAKLSNEAHLEMPTPEAITSWMGFICTALAPSIRFKGFSSSDSDVSLDVRFITGTLEAVIEAVSAHSQGKSRRADFGNARLAHTIGALAASAHLQTACYLMDQLSLILSPISFTSNGEVISDRRVGSSPIVKDVSINNRCKLEFLEELVPIHDPMSRLYLLPHSKIKCPLNLQGNTPLNIPEDLTHVVTSQVRRIIEAARRHASAAHSLLVPLISSKIRVSHFIAPLSPLLLASARAAGLSGDLAAQTSYLLEILAPGPSLSEASSYSSATSTDLTLRSYPSSLELRVNAMCELMRVIPKLVAYNKKEDDGDVDYVLEARKHLLFTLKAKLRKELGGRLKEDLDLPSVTKLLDWTANQVSSLRLRDPGILWSPLMRFVVGYAKRVFDRKQGVYFARPTFVIPPNVPSKADPAMHVVAAAILASFAQSSGTKAGKIADSIVADGTLAVRSESSYALRAGSGLSTSALASSANIFRGVSPVEVSYLFLTDLEDSFSSVCSASSNVEARMLSPKTILTVGKSFQFVVSITSYFPIAVVYRSISFGFSDERYNIELRYQNPEVDTLRTVNDGVVLVSAPLVFGAFQTRQFVIEMNAHTATASPVTLEQLVKAQGDWQKVIATLLAPDMVIANSVVQNQQKSLSAAYAAAYPNGDVAAPQKTFESIEGFRGVQKRRVRGSRDIKQYTLREGLYPVAPGQAVPPHATFAISSRQETLADVGESFDVNTALHSLKPQNSRRVSDKLPHRISGAGLGRLECSNATFELCVQEHIPNPEKILQRRFDDSSFSERLTVLLASHSKLFASADSASSLLNETAPCVLIKVPCSPALPCPSNPTPYRLQLPASTPFFVFQAEPTNVLMNRLNSQIATALFTPNVADPATTHWTVSSVVISTSQSNTNEAKDDKVAVPSQSEKAKDAASDTVRTERLRHDPHDISLSNLLSMNPSKGLLSEDEEQRIFISKNGSLRQTHSDLVIMEKQAHKLPDHSLRVLGRQVMRSRLLTGEKLPIEFVLPPHNSAMNSSSDSIDVVVVFVQVANLDLGTEGQMRPSQLALRASSIRKSKWKNASNPKWHAVVDSNGTLSTTDNLLDTWSTFLDESSEEEDEEEDEDDEGENHDEKEMVSPEQQVKGHEYDSESKGLRDERSRARALHAAKQTTLSRALLKMSAPRIEFKEGQSITPLFVGVPNFRGVNAAPHDYYNLPSVEPTFVSSRRCDVHGARSVSTFGVCDESNFELDGGHWMSAMYATNSDVKNTGNSCVPLEAYSWKEFAGHLAIPEVENAVNSEVPKLAPREKIGDIIGSFAEKIDWESLREEPAGLTSVPLQNGDKSFSNFAFALPKSSKDSPSKVEALLLNPMIPCDIELTFMVIRKSFQSKNEPRKESRGPRGQMTQLFTHVNQLSVRMPFEIKTQHLRAPSIKRVEEAGQSTDAANANKSSGTRITFDYSASTVLVPTTNAKGEKILGRISLCEPKAAGNSLLCGGSAIAKFDIRSIAACRCAEVPVPLSRITGKVDKKHPSENHHFTDYGQELAEMFALEADSCVDSKEDALVVHSVDIRVNPLIFEPIPTQNCKKLLNRVLYEGDRVGVILPLKVRQRVPSAASTFFGYISIQYSRKYSLGEARSTCLIPLKQAYLVADAVIQASVCHPLITKLDSPIPVTLTVKNTNSNLPVVVRFAVDTTAPSLLPPTPAKAAAGTTPWPQAGAQYGYPPQITHFNSAAGLVAGAGLPQTNVQMQGGHPLSPMSSPQPRPGNSDISIVTRSPTYSVSPPILPVPQMVVMGRGFRLIILTPNSEKSVTFDLVPLTSGRIGIPSIAVTVAVPITNASTSVDSEESSKSILDEKTIDMLGSILGPNSMSTPEANALASQFLFASLTTQHDFGTVFVSPPEIRGGEVVANPDSA